MTLAQGMAAIQGKEGFAGMQGIGGMGSGLVGNLLLCVVILVCIELSLLLGYWFLYKRGIAPRAIVANIGAGGCLIAALWSATVLQSPAVMMCLLLVSLCFHIVDLATRWQS